MGSFPPPNSGDDQRRSQHVRLHTPVVVLARGIDDMLVSEETRTVVVNSHGAVILLRLGVTMGELLTLRNSGIQKADMKFPVEWFTLALIYWIGKR